jgi:hypothetical protein
MYSQLSHPHLSAAVGSPVSQLIEQLMREPLRPDEFQACWVALGTVVETLNHAHARSKSEPLPGLPGQLMPRASSSFSQGAA